MILLFLARSLTGCINVAGLSGHAHKNWGSSYEQRAVFVRVVALVLMVLAIVVAVYAAWVFHYRGEMLQQKVDAAYDSRFLPILLGSMLVVSLLIVFGGAIAEFIGST
jgi:uncharacterized protein involved in cysteine biosynthesis